MLGRVAAVVLLLPLPVLAAQPVPPPTTALSANVARLPAGVLEAKVERRVDGWGMAVLVAGAHRAADIQGFGQSTTVGLGVQALWYARGDYYRGMTVGAETRYERRSTTNGGLTPGNPEVITAVGQAWHLALLIGGRYALPSGLFVAGQLGGRVVYATTTASCCSTVLASADSVRVLPLVGVDLGWLF